MTLQELIPLLEAKGLKPRQLPNGQFLALCPSHDDTHPSLCVAEGNDGRILLYCHAGCDFASICDALSVTPKELMGDAASSDGDVPQGCRLVHLCGDCESLRQALLALGCREVSYPIDGQKIPAVAFPLTTPDGQTFTHFRISPEGRDKWRLEAGAPAKRLLFALQHALQRAQQTKAVIVTESPLDASVLYACGFAAVSVVGKANAAAIGVFRHLVPEEIQIYAWVEPNAERFARDLADALRRPVFAFASPNPQAKDAWRLLKANGWDINRTRDQIAAVIVQAVRIIPTPQTLREILDAIADFIRQFVILSPEQVDTVALWVAHTWVTEATDVTPYLRINSATKRCGKSRLAEVIACLAREPKFTTCVSTASLFRLAHQSQGQMTLIVDEVEGTFSSKEKAGELTALLNAGWRRGLTVPRVEKTKDGWRVFEFQTFCPKVLVGLGRLADTVEDRAIHITLQRKRPEETVRDFIWQDAQTEAEPIREALECWASDPQTVAALRLSRPAMPRNISDRAREGWRLLVAIADAAGGDWSERARRAMMALEQVREDLAFNVRLLEALQHIFMERQAERLTVAEICQALTEMDDPPVPEDFWRWVAVSDWRRAGAWLARTLKPFGVHPKKVRVGGDTKQGYELADFAEAFARYLPPTPTDPNPCPPTPTGLPSTEEVSAPVPFVPFAPEQTEREKPNKNWACSIVPFVPFPVEKSGNFHNKLTQDEAGSEITQAPKPSFDPTLAVNSPNSLTQTEEGSEETDIVPLPNGTNGTSEQPQQNKGFLCSVSETQNGTNGTSEGGASRTEPENPPTDLPTCEDAVYSEASDTDSLTWLCPRCGFTERRPIGTDLFADPVCRQCGARMRLAPEDDGGAGAPLPDSPTEPPDSNPPSPSPPEKAQATSTGEAADAFVSTEEWIDALWAEVGQSPPDAPLPEGEPVPQELIDLWVSDPRSLTFEVWLAEWQAKRSRSESLPIVTDLETGESIPVGDFLVSALRPCRCPRCGHQDAAPTDSLLPPLCPACKSPMQWEVPEG